MGGGAFVLPIVHDVTEVSMNTLRLEVRRARREVADHQGPHARRSAVEFFLRVIPSPIRSPPPRERWAIAR